MNQSESDFDQIPSYLNLYRARSTEELQAILVAIAEVFRRRGYTFPGFLELKTLSKTRGEMLAEETMKVMFNQHSKGAFYASRSDIPNHAYNSLRDSLINNYNPLSPYNLLYTLVGLNKSIFPTVPEGIEFHFILECMEHISNVLTVLEDRYDEVHFVNSIPHLDGDNKWVTNSPARSKQVRIIRRKHQ